MLKLGAFLHHQFGGATATVFQDDVQFWRFYVIPGFPQVRLTPEGNPYFMLVKYKLSDDSREDDPDLPAGGGYMVFDAELRLSDEHRAALEAELQGHVDEEYARLKAEASQGSLTRKLEVKATLNDTLNPVWQGRGHHGGVREPGERELSTSIDLGQVEQLPLPPEAPKVVFGEPLWVGGQVTMTAPNDPNLVRGEVLSQKASLLGNNNASFNLNLTPNGATFMEKTLVGEGGTGMTDLSPIQVRYDLTFRAKLPPARMHLSFDSGRVYTALQELFHEHDSSGCDDDYFTSETMMSAAKESGLIDLKIDMGGIADEELQQLLMSQATKQATELLKTTFADVDREPLEEWADEDVANSGREIYRLKRQTEVELKEFNQTTEIVSTIDHTISPNGTLAVFFRGRSDMDRFVRTVDLNDDFFKTLRLSVRAFANWEQDQVSFVDVEVRYDQGGGLKTNTFTFTPTATDPQWWDPSLVDGKREYDYRWRVRFQDQAEPEWSDWASESTRDLNISVESPGKLDVTVTGVGLDFAHVLDAVLVHLRYADPSQDVAMVSQSVLLTAERASGQWIRELFAPYEQPVEYRVQYLLKNGNRVDVDWARTDGPTQNLLIVRPDVEVLDVTLLPAGAWTGVIQTVASLRYVEGADTIDEQYRFETREEFAEWAVLLSNPANRRFEYKVTSTFENGDVQNTEWREAEGDQSLPIVVAGPPRLEVSVNGQVADYVSTPVIKVDLAYDDPEGRSEVAAFTFQTAQDVHSWSVPVGEDGPRSYRFKTTYFPATGNAVEQDWRPETTNLLLVPRFTIPIVGAEFIPAVIDFARVTAVEVAIDYRDPTRGLAVQESLVFTPSAPASQSWFLPVAETSPREYTYVVTYWYPDGGQASRDAVTMSKSKIVIPPAPARDGAAVPTGGGTVPTGGTPPMGGGTTPPAGGGTVPPTGGTTPPTGGGTLPPTGGTTPPAGGGTTPPTGGGTLPPTGGTTPPTGGGTPPPTGGGGPGTPVGGGPGTPVS